MFFNQGNVNSNNNNNSNNSNNSLNFSPSTNNASTKSQQCHLILQKYFKHESFRQHQLEIILNTLNGNDSLVIMATGSGKSLCYQIPPIYSRKPAIVVSPLLSLIQNQIQSLQSRGIAAIAFTSANKMTSLDYTEAFENNTYSIIYITPEGIDSKLHHLKKLQNKHGISCIAIDESHCVSEWGFDFRPQYKQLYKLRDNLPNIPILALTATATKKVQTDIVNILKIRPQSFISSFNRTNLTYIFKEKTSGKDGGIENDLCNLHARKHYYTNGSTIIYTSTRKDSEKIANLLCQKGIRAAAYHGGLNASIRKQVQIEWENNNYQCICATIAFGMGIDKPDIRFVIHYGMCDSIEAYYQHTGRAGRDGADSKCIVFWSKGDFSKSDWRASLSSNMQHQNLIVQQTQLLKQFTYTRECRIKFILRHFGEEFGECINRCDNCIEKYRKQNKNGMVTPSKVIAKDYTSQVKCLVQACQQTGQRYGITMLIHIVGGKENKKTNNAYGVKQKRAWGALKKYSINWITALSRKAIELGFLGEIWMNSSGGFRRGYKRIYVTQSGQRLLSGVCSVPEWVPDSDMVKAEKETQSKAMSSKKWSFKGGSNKGNVMSPAPRTNAKSSSGWGFKGGSNTKKRSFSQVSESGNSNSNNKSGNIFSQRAVSSVKRRKISDVVVTADSVNSLMELSLNNRAAAAADNVKVDKPALTIAQTGDDLKQKLISIRKKLAQKNGLIAYQVISNDGIDVLDLYRPSTLEHLKIIAGKGHKNVLTDGFINKWGKVITCWIKKYCEKNGLNMDVNINECKEESVVNNTEQKMEVDTMENNNEQLYDINAPIVVPPPENANISKPPIIPKVTVQSREIYETFCSGVSINEIVQKRLIKRDTVEKCLSNMIINGYKLDWNILDFTYNEIRTCFMVLVAIGYDKGYDMIRNENKEVLGKFKDSEIDILIARFIIDNLAAPKSKKHGKKWTVDDDRNLWVCRNECVLELANKLERSIGSIMGRLQHLKDQKHKNHKRLEGVIGVFGQGNIECMGRHNVCEGNELLEEKYWNVMEDVCLFENRDCDNGILMKHFGVKIGVLNERLMDLSGIDYGVRYRMLKEKEKRVLNENTNNCNNSNSDNSTNNKEFLCPITHEIMSDPVLTEDGITYDRNAIEEWLKNHNTSPVTNVKLKDKRLIPNYSLKSLIEKSQSESQNDSQIECKNVILMEDYNKCIIELLGKSTNGVRLDEFVSYLCIQSDNVKINFLKETLQEMSDGFQIYQKDDRYFAF